MLEKNYNQNYFIQDIPKDILEMYANPKIDPSPNNLKLDLMPKNIFIPRNFDILSPFEQDKT